MKKKYAFLFLLGALALFVIGYLMSGQNDEMLLNEPINAYNLVINKLNSSQKADELEGLPFDDKLKDDVNLKVAALAFKQAEESLKLAKDLQLALGEVPEREAPTENQSGEEDLPEEFHAPPPPPEVKIHPKAMDAFKIAEKYYFISKKHIDKVTTKNYEINYIKGEIYHRHLQFFTKQENMSQVYKQTLDFYKDALTSKPGDMNTIVNIELLLKEFEGQSGGGGEKPAQKMLNQIGIGRSKGN